MYRLLAEGICLIKKLDHHLNVTHNHTVTLK